MNYFFALTLPEEIRDYAARYSLNWRAKLTPSQSANWLLPEDYHITLKFLGNVDQSRETELIEAVLPVMKQQSSLKVQLAPAGKFPTVLWIGIKQDTHLEKLASRLDTVLRALAFKPEYRPYRPHITVARYTQKPNINGVNFLAPYEQVFPFWQADRFVLMQTLPPERRQNEAKARYNIVHTFPFGIMPS